MQKEVIGTRLLPNTGSIFPTIFPKFCSPPKTLPGSSLNYH